MVHHHHPIDPEAGDRRIATAVAVNIALTLLQIIGGIVSGSLALIADALHNFSDAISLIIAFWARKIARKPADAQMTFGYGRAEIVAALINYTTLIVVALYLIYEAVVRFFNPQSVDGWWIVWVAGAALLVDLITAALTYRMSKTSINIRAAFLHNLSDALGSLAVIVAGSLILLYDWHLFDPLVTLMIALYILYLSYKEIGSVIRILMLGSPPDLDTREVLAHALEVDGVSDIHHAHLWMKGEHEIALDAHLVIDAKQWVNADAIKCDAKAAIAEKYGIHHTTFELECSAHACVDPKTIGRHYAEPSADWQQLAK